MNPDPPVTRTLLMMLSVLSAVLYRIQIRSKRRKSCERNADISAAQFDPANNGGCVTFPSG